ncbi:uncharacterized protein LOC125496410 [Beta vulgaris subsp. vulgaris]|uniref:uncharacterized protein LOC125496410 n=1 Tax=Beta vulgaris subsp. vulgaris TaxID=3555 RepID=UPI00254952D6|nr:uncharacterized protein LOC125496410 [Beta vulgaris subsp. vulgaris]
MICLQEIITMRKNLIKLMNIGRWIEYVGINYVCGNCIDMSKRDDDTLSDEYEEEAECLEEEGGSKRKKILKGSKRKKRLKGVAEEVGSECMRRKFKFTRDMFR